MCAAPINPLISTRIKEGKRRLAYTGQVYVKKEDNAQFNLSRLGQQSMMTQSNDDCSSHLIVYSDDMEVLVSPALFHELCHVKLNEIGYKQVEVHAKEILKDDPTAKSYPGDVDSSLIIVAECYAEWMYYHYFENETAEWRSSIVAQYLRPSMLSTIYKESGFWGMGRISYQEKAFEWLGNLFPREQLVKTICQCIESQQMIQDLDEIDQSLSKLKRLPFTKEGQLGSIGSSTIDNLVDVVLELFFESIT
jgi:hypothetical protein